MTFIKRNYKVLVVVVIAIVVILYGRTIYSWYIENWGGGDISKFFDLSFWQNFASNGLATLLGVIVGIPIALWVANFQERRTEKEHRKKILLVLKVELLENRQSLTNWVDECKPRIPSIALNAFLKDESWSAFSDGGELQWIKDPLLLAELSDAFSTIRAVKYVCDKNFTLMEFPTEETSAIAGQTVWNLLNATVTYGIAQIDKTLAAIEKKL